MPRGIGDTAFERGWRLGSTVRVRKRCRVPHARLATALPYSARRFRRTGQVVLSASRNQYPTNEAETA
jgi:hypothetical protein